MVKFLFLAFIILGAGVLVFLRVNSSAPEQPAAKRKVASKKLPRQVAEDRPQPNVKSRRGEVDPDATKATDGPPNQTVPTEKPKQTGSDIKPPVKILGPPLKPKSGKVVDNLSSLLPDGLPLWFRVFDKDEDGQVALSEWQKSGKSLDEFRKNDLNGDGLLTAEEVRRLTKKAVELKFEKDQARYNGAIDPAGEMYMGKKLSKIFPIKFEKGKTYQIDHASQAFDAYLYLEDQDGNLVAENDDGGGGNDSRLVYNCDRTGIYRIIATSVGGYRPGDFSLVVRVIDVGGAAAKGLPSWFNALDKNGDGQVSIQEWRESGKPVDEFRKHDLHGDGFITAAEVLRRMGTPTKLKMQKGHAKSKGAIEFDDHRYQGKKLSKNFTIELAKGTTYQIDLVSQEFSAYLYLEDDEGNLLNKIHSGGKGLTARIIHRAASTANYRIIVTSQDGTKIGDFSLWVRVNQAGK